MLGQHHVTSLAAALEALRVYSCAAEEFPTPLAPELFLDLPWMRALVDLHHHNSSRQRFNNLRPNGLRAQDLATSRPTPSVQDATPALRTSVPPRRGLHVSARLPPHSAQTTKPPAPLLHPSPVTQPLDIRVSQSTTQPSFPHPWSREPLRQGPPGNGRGGRTWLPVLRNPHKALARSTVPRRICPEPPFLRVEETTTPSPISPAPHMAPIRTQHSATHGCEFFLLHKISPASHPGLLSE